MQSMNHSIVALLLKSYLRVSLSADGPKDAAVNGREQHVCILLASWQVAGSLTPVRFSFVRDVAAAQPRCYAIGSTNCSRQAGNRGIE